MCLSVNSDTVSAVLHAEQYAYSTYYISISPVVQILAMYSILFMQSSHVDESIFVIDIFHVFLPSFLFPQVKFVPTLSLSLYLSL